MLINIFEGILIPFVGTTIGSACVFFMRQTLSKSVQRALAGFAAGIMVAASIWSLLIPAIKQYTNPEPNKRNQYTFKNIYSHYIFLPYMLEKIHWQK